MNPPADLRYKAPYPRRHVFRPAMTRRIFYASAGQANLIRSHEFWTKGDNNPDEVSLTFSGQIETFIADIDGQALMVSGCADGKTLADGRFTIEHWPEEPAQGAFSYYFGELRKAWRMLRAAKRFRADVALLDSGALPYFMMSLFRLAGLPVIIVLHNTIWPRGFRPRRGLRGLVSRLDGLFFRWGANVVIAVSPECARQVEELAPGHRCTVMETRAQFQPGYFRDLPAPPDWSNGTFNVTFIGRVNKEKGVFDIVDMARRAETRFPGRIRWTICGRGPALDEVRAAIGDGLKGVVEAPGWVSLEQLRQIHATSHAWIVPTRSAFAEGLAMTVVEAVLAGRPVVTNPVVPAHEVLAPAVLLGRTNDAASHAEAVIRLATDRDLYERLRLATTTVGNEFYDRSRGLTAVLHQAIAALPTR